MKPVQFLLNCLILGAFALFIAACQKQESAQVDVDVEIQDVNVTLDLGNGEKKLDFTVVVTQIGNTFLRDYKMVFTKYGSTVVLDSFQTTLPTAREFLKHSVQPVESGTYEAYITLRGDGINYGYGKLVKVP